MLQPDTHPSMEKSPCHPSVVRGRRVHGEFHRETVTPAAQVSPCRSGVATR